MKTYNVAQGSKEWHDIRVKHHTASEAPVMMGASKLMRRDELLSMKKLGIEKEVSEYTQRFLFDKGHEQEAAIRPHIEKLVGDDLYPVTGSETVEGLPLLASFDGLTMMEDIVFEHKMFNEKLARYVADHPEPPEEYVWQLEQQLLVSGAEQAIFVVSDGTPDNMVYCWYAPVEGRRQRLIAGWKQFESDIADHEHIVDTPKPEVAEIESLPALEVQLQGQVVASNIEVYEERAIAFVESINKDLQTDEDFATAEQTVKFCSTAENELKAVKEHALSQTASISQLFGTIDRISERLRKTRLDLDKLVKAEKERIKAEIVNGGIAKIGEHLRALNESLGGSYMPQIDTSGFVAGIKSKRTLSSIRGAVNDELARLKIETNDIAEQIRANLKHLDEKAADYPFLFNDLNLIVSKDPDDFAAVVYARVTEYREQEAEKEAQRQRDASAKREQEQATPQDPAATDTTDMSENQDFVDGMDSDRPAEEAALSAAERKQQERDVEKLKKYVGRLTNYKVPDVKDEKVSQILGMIVQRLDSIENYVADAFPDDEESSEAA